MADYMNKVKVNTAIVDHTNDDLSHQHITTADFMQLNVAMTYEMSPTQKIDVKDETFARCNPLPVPTFGRASLRNRAFFVPYSSIYRAFSDYITDAVHVASDNKTYGLVSVVPTITNKQLADIFITNVAPDIEDPCESDYLLYEITLQDLINGGNFDVAYLGSDDATYSFYNFTSIGRRVFSLLEQLGYKIIWSVNYVEAKPLSLLPILALFKVYTDWYFPNQYTNLALYDETVAMLNYDGATPLTGQYTAKIRQSLKMCAYVQYDADYFTSLWDQPSAPSSGTYSTFNIPDVTVRNSQSQNVAQSYVHNSQYIASQTYNVNQTPIISGYNSGGTGNNLIGPYNISQYVLNGLKALTDYMKRHQLVGSKSIDRYISRFGVSIPSERMHRSIYLGSSMQSVQIGDVMSTASTDGATLGDYSGKALSYGTGHWNYEAEEYGLFIVLTSIVPNVGYYQGIEPTLKHVYKEDFFTPEFDNLFVTPVTADELFVPQFYVPSFDGLDEQIFGYAPRYYENKFKLDKVTGNWRIPTINGSNPIFNGSVDFNASDSWHLFRRFKEADFPNGASDIVHNYYFVSGKSDFAQYKRIFYNADACAPDNFTIIHNFEIGSVAPWKSAFDTYSFRDNGKKVTEEINGVKMN